MIFEEITYRNTFLLLLLTVLTIQFTLRLISIDNMTIKKFYKEPFVGLFVVINSYLKKLVFQRTNVINVWNFMIIYIIMLFSLISSLYFVSNMMNYSKIGTEIMSFYNVSILCLIYLFERNVFSKKLYDFRVSEYFLVFLIIILNLILSKDAYSISQICLSVISLGINIYMIFSLVRNCLVDQFLHVEKFILICFISSILINHTAFYISMIHLDINLSKNVLLAIAVFLLSVLNIYLAKNKIFERPSVTYQQIKSRCFNLGVTFFLIKVMMWI